MNGGKNDIDRLVDEIKESIMLEENLEVDEETIEEIKREIKKRLLKKLKKKSQPKEEKEEEFVRFSLNVRIQHFFLALSVILLILTGLPIKFHEAGWAIFLMKLMGGIKVTRIIHRAAATILGLVGIYHLGWIIFSEEGRSEFKYLLPRWKDIKDFYQNVMYFLGRTEERPKFDRFSYIEKFDYWAVYWGMVIMIGSGVILTFFPYMVAFVPKFVFDIAREVHSDEALLATLAIVIWHWYNAHFNPEVFPFNPTIFTGKIPKERMIKEHYLEYQRIVNKQKEEQAEKGIEEKEEFK